MYEGYEDDLRDAWLADYVEEELRHLSEAPAIEFLAHNGDAIEERVLACLEEAQTLKNAGFAGAGLVRAAAGIEVAIRFFLARPLLQGAFLSNEWAKLLSQKVLNGRNGEERELLPKILRNWKIDITSMRLSDGRQLWETIVTRVWQRRNDYVHAGSSASDEDVGLAIDCLRALLDDLVGAIATRLGFTRVETGCWSVIAVKNPPEFPDLNPPRRYLRLNPF